MIRVTVELLPGGSERNKEHLGTAYIANDGTGTGTVGNYTIALSKRGRPAQIWKRGKVSGFLRKRYLAWDLLALALLVTLGDERLVKALGRNLPAESTQPPLEEGD